MDYVAVEQKDCLNCDRPLSELPYADITSCEVCYFLVCRMCLQTGPCWNCKLNEQESADETEMEEETENEAHNEEQSDVEASSSGLSQDDDENDLQECRGGSSGEKHMCKKEKMTRFGSCIDCLQKKTNKSFVKNKNHHEKIKKLDIVKENIIRAMKDVLEPWEKEILGELLPRNLDGEELYIQLKAILMSKHPRNWRSKLKAVNVELQELLVGYGFAAVLVGFKPRKTGGHEYEVVGPKEIVSALDNSQDIDKNGQVRTTSLWNAARDYIHQKLKQMYPQSRIPTVLQAEIAGKVLAALGNLKKIQKPIAVFALSESATKIIDQKILKAMDGDYETEVEKDEEDDSEDEDIEPEDSNVEVATEDTGEHEDFDGEPGTNDREEYITELIGNGIKAGEENDLDGCGNQNMEEVEGDLNTADYEDYENNAKEDTETMFQFSPEIRMNYQNEESKEQILNESGLESKQLASYSPTSSQVQKIVPSRATKLLSPNMNKVSSTPNIRTSNTKVKVKPSAVLKPVISTLPAKLVSSKVDKNQNQSPLPGIEKKELRRVVAEKNNVKETRNVIIQKSVLKDMGISCDKFDNLVNFIASSWNRNFDDELISDSPQFYSNLAHSNLPNKPEFFEQTRKPKSKKRKLETPMEKSINSKSIQSKMFQAVGASSKRPTRENSIRSNEAQMKKNEASLLVNNSAIPNNEITIQTNGNVPTIETSESLVKLSQQSSKQKEGNSDKKPNIGNFKPPSVNILSRGRKSSTKSKKDTSVNKGGTANEKENSNLGNRKINEKKKYLSPPLKTPKSKKKKALNTIGIKNEPIKDQVTNKLEPNKAQVKKAKPIKIDETIQAQIKNRVEPIHTNKTLPTMRYKLRVNQLEQNDENNKDTELYMGISTSKKMLNKSRTVKTLETPPPSSK